ncbi:MAG: sulfur relay protein DsrC [Proteobacteria bacterium]|nr:sulfur relay protein DsrC [Pseudomonadota bacterium]
MLNLSELVIQHPEVGSFHDIVLLVRQRAADGEILLHFDVKPDYIDTPRNWQWQLETAFNRGMR